MIAVFGNLARDLFPGRPPRVGGGPFHAARALCHVDTRARLYTRCAIEDREALVLPVARFGTPVSYVPGDATASFGIGYDGDRRVMRVEAIGDVWAPGDVPELPAEVRWVHVAPLLRSDFTPETLARIADGRRLSLDGQGLVRVAARGALRLDGAYDAALLASVTVLKLADEEASVVGDPTSLSVPEVLVTHGIRGATVYAGGRAEHVPAFPVEVESTGAGDGFMVAYVAARADGCDPVAAARRAAATVAVMLAGDKPRP